MLWGHGANLQGDPRSWRERVKRWTGRRADWWLAYTAMSLPLILRTGFPEERITVLNNAVDTDEMREQRARVNPNTIASARAHYGFSGEHIGVFVGSLYADKRIDFLLQAADRVRERVPDFELLVLGSGPLSREVERFCDMRPWARWGGVCKGFDKVNAIAMSRLMLNPGLVGLGILDAFVCGVPMVTTDCGIHSPEIAYLQSGENGVMTANDLNVYVDAVVRLLQDAPFLEHLGAGCTASAQRYSVGNMALNFVQGVDACLRQPMWR
jgi:glycosyltransferase involved in cell wall biosynthesis